MGQKCVEQFNLFVYSDPAQGKIDINKFDLVINVAKECDNMSLQYMNQVLIKGNMCTFHGHIIRTSQRICFK